MNKAAKSQTDIPPAPTHISCQDDLDQGLKCLCAIEPSLAPVIEEVVASVGPIPLRLRPAGFKGLAEIVVGQQVSKASAAAIFGRLDQTVSPFDAQVYLGIPEEKLIATGLSRAKQVTLLRLAQAIADGELDIDALTQMAPDVALEQLVQLKGIGPWTAEVFLLFCVGHTDIFPAGDIALQQAIADIYGMDARPDIKTVRFFAERWSPVRGVAARVLWAQYASARKRFTLPV